MFAVTNDSFKDCDLAYLAKALHPETLNLQSLKPEILTNPKTWLCRYLNSMAVKWLFRAGEIQRAESTAALFTKDGEQVNNLFDMQCMWYEIECGMAHLRKKEYGKVLPN